MKEVYDFIKKSGVYYLGTVEDNKPRIRPFGVLEIYEDKLYILTGKKKNVFKQIEKNNQVEICASIGEEWIRVSAELIVDDRLEAKKAILDKNPHLRVAYSENDDNTKVLYLKNVAATISSLITNESQEYKF